MTKYLVEGEIIVDTLVIINDMLGFHEAVLSAIPRGALQNESASDVTTLVKSVKKYKRIQKGLTDALPSGPTLAFKEPDNG